MQLNKSQKKFIKKNLKRLSVAQIAKSIQISEKELVLYLKEYWGEDKLNKFLSKNNPEVNNFENKKQLNFIGFKDWLKKYWKLVVLFSIIAFLTYTNSLGNAFLSDDIATIRDNPDVGNFSNVFYGRFPFFSMIKFFQDIVFSLFRKNPTFFRLINVFSHIGSTSLILYLMTVFFGFPINIIVTGIFAVHTILSESVIWISGIPYSVGTFFTLISFCLYLNFRNNKKIILYILSIFLYIFALQLNAKLISFVVLLGLYEILFNFKIAKIKNIVLSLLPFVIIVSIMTLSLLGAAQQRSHDLKTIHYQQSTTENLLLKVPVALGSYLSLIFWPEKLTFYHSELNFTKFQFLMLTFLTILYFGLLIFFFFKNKKIFFWLSLFILGLIPDLAPFGLGWVVAERYVYFSSIGIFVLIAYLINKLSVITKKPVIQYVLLGVIVSSLCVRTFIRNFDWKDQDVLWLATDKYSPSSPQNHNNLGDLYGRRGQFEKSIEEFQKAVRLMPNYGDALHNMANIYVQMGKMDLAIENYQKALQFNPNLWQSHQNLGSIYFNLGQFSLAEEHFKKAVTISPQNSSLHAALGIILLSENKKEESIEELKIALTLDPNNEQAQNALKQALGN